MDSKLKFYIHTDFTAKKANCNNYLGLISKVFECMDLDDIPNPWSVHCLSITMQFGGPFYIMDKHKIEAIQ